MYWTKSGMSLKIKGDRYQYDLKNAISKIDVNMDCFLLIKGQWKLFKGGKVRELFTFWWVATMFQCLWKIVWLLNYNVLLLLNFIKTS